MSQTKIPNYQIVRCMKITKEFQQGHIQAVAYFGKTFYNLQSFIEERKRQLNF